MQPQPTELALTRALVLQPDHPGVLRALIVLCEGQGRIAEAQALAARLPLDGVPAEEALGIGLQRAAQRRWAAAEAAFRQVLAQRPGHAAALNNLGNVLAEQGRHAEAEAAFRDLLAQAATVDAWLNLALVLREASRLADAEQAVRGALALDAESLKAHAALGRVLVQAGRHDEAAAAYRLVLARSPEDAGAANELGKALLQADRLAEAAAVFRQGVALRPDSVVMWVNLGMALRDLGRPDEAEAAYRQALALEPAHVDARIHLCFLLLSLDRYEEGWPWLAVRHLPEVTGRHLPQLAYPAWQGEPLAGRRLALWHEQGFGDFLQFIRLAPLLRERGLAWLTVVCPPELVSLARGVAGVDAVLTQGQELPPHDFWALLMDLPQPLGLGFDQLPATRLPYLQAPPGRVAHWRERLPPGRKVGLVWKGSAVHQNDMRRSLPGLATLAPLWSVPGWTFVSLQKGAGEDEALAPPPGQPLLALGPDLQDFGDTAAVLELLDVVICVDTSIAHLAGALARPAWVLVPAINSDWRWGFGRTDSPWYPGVLRLFRQRTPRQWDDVVVEVAQALREWAA